MKSHIILFVLVSFILGGQLSAQTASVTGTMRPANTTPAPTELALLAQQHNRIAVQQIRQHLSTNISYPQAMENLALEGTVQLQLTINRRGEIRNIRVLSSELPGTFSETGIEIMEKLKSIRLAEGAYYGKATFNVPLHFSL